jgi:hypothetical protein
MFMIGSGSDRHKNLQIQNSTDSIRRTAFLSFFYPPFELSRIPNNNKRTGTWIHITLLPVFYLQNVQEHEERIGFLRERHELEGKIMTLQDMLERSGDEEQVRNREQFRTGLEQTGDEEQVGNRRGTENRFGTDGEQRTSREQAGNRKQVEISRGLENR